MRESPARDLVGLDNLVHQTIITAQNSTGTVLTICACRSSSDMNRLASDADDDDLIFELSATSSSSLAARLVDASTPPVV